jgi:hypothetical protein
MCIDRLHLDTDILSSFGDSPHIDFSAIYSINDSQNTTSFSLRSSNEHYDVSEIAKIYGGGGHRNASGLFSQKLTNVLDGIVYDTTGQYCSVEDTLKIKMIKTVNNSIEINIVKIYPNPAKDKVFIDVGDINFQSGNSITITNAVGQEIYANAITEKLTQIDISNWNSNGIYIFKIKDSQICTNHKLVS